MVHPLRMFHPSRDEFVQAAASANLIPVYRELCADSDTPVSAYAALGGGDYSFLLESVVGGATWAAFQEETEAQSQESWDDAAPLLPGGISGRMPYWAASWAILSR